VGRRGQVSRSIWRAPGAGFWSMEPWYTGLGGVLPTVRGWHGGGNLVVAPAASLRPSAEWKASATLACFGPAEAMPFPVVRGRRGLRSCADGGGIAGVGRVVGARGNFVVTPAASLRPSAEWGRPAHRARCRAMDGGARRRKFSFLCGGQFSTSWYVPERDLPSR